MTKFQIFTPVVDEFISLLEQQENIRWKKVWNINGRTIGVYFIEVFPLTLSAESALVNVVIDHDKDEHYCLIWIEPFGTGMVAPDKTMKEIIRGIGKISISNKWHFERLVTKYGGDTCPYCKATYKYRQKSDIESSIRTCQNCGKEFDTDVPLESEKGREDARFKLSPCPYCKAAYYYRRKHVQDDDTVACQNCGESFLLQIDDWIKYSYDWYQDDDNQ